MHINENNKYKIIAVDDEIGILDSLNVFLTKSGYSFVGITDPLEAIERVKQEHFDLMLLDFIMTPIHGDKVVEEIRKFNKNLYILLLTGHRNLAPPLETIRKLDIQGYCEKSDKFDQLLLLIESGIKAISQMYLINQINAELERTYGQLEASYMESIETLKNTVEAKDVYTKGHSDRVSAFAVLLGKKLGLSEDDIENLRVGGIFHDVGKLQELSTFPENDYTDAGQLLGHIMIGANRVAERIKSIPDFPKTKAMELQHCILAHHGELEFGSPKKPAIVEAIALSFADNVDAKMETFKEAMSTVPANNLEWQGFNRFLDSNIRRTSAEKN